MADVHKLRIDNVRLSYPALFEPVSFQDGPGPVKYQASFLIEPDNTQTLKIVKTEIARVLKENKAKVPEDKLCLRENAEGEGFILKSASDRRPVVLNKDKSAVSETDDILYPGCYCTGLVSLWYQDNKYGKRVNASLIAVQFVRDGDRFGVDYGDVTEDFDDLTGETSEVGEDLDDDDDLDDLLD